MNMFKKKSDSNETKNIIKTGAGVSIKDKLKMLTDKSKDIFQNETQNKPIPKKIKPPNELSEKLMHSHGSINNLQISQENEIKKADNNNKKKEKKSCRKRKKY